MIYYLPPMYSGLLLLIEDYGSDSDGVGISDSHWVIAVIWDLPCSMAIM